MRVDVHGSRLTALSLLLTLLFRPSMAKLFPINPHIPLEGTPANPGTPWPKPASMQSSQQSLYTFAPSDLLISAASNSIRDCEIYQYEMEIISAKLFPLGMNTAVLPGVLVIEEIRFETAECSSTASWCESYPSLDTSPNDSCSSEQYEIMTEETDSNDAAAVVIRSNTIWGALHAVETLAQLIWMKDNSYVMNETVVEDRPRFPHRGLMLDSARHFIPMRDIELVIKAMRMNKFNVLHWHLSDDQSFPYESSTFPELSAQGAYSPNHIYSAEDVKNVITFARINGIRVIPEFDAPGHTYAMGRGRPELLTPCFGDSVTPGTPNFPIHADHEVLNPMLDSTFDFLRRFYEEIVAVFADQYVHLGMDEVNHNCWKSSPDITEFMDSNGLTDYSQLEGYIIQRHISQILDLGVSHIVWQDPLEKGIEFPSETIVQIWKWHSTDMGWTDWSEYLAYVTGLGHKAILSSCWYLNLISYGEDWIDYYQCDPHNFEGSEEQKSLVLGGETTFWAEYIDETNLHSRIWPRASAVAEKLWSQTTDSVPDARHRLDQHRCNMIKRGFQAAPVFNGFCPVERVS